jgi:diacylglycerol kinase (ATP)
MGEATSQGRQLDSEPATSIALLVNPGSGKGEAERARLELAEAGAAVDVYSLSDWERAASSNPARIAVAGGDGSVGCAAAAAAISGVPLAVVPAGTANDFARALGLPDDLATACRLAVRGTKTRALELGRMDDRPFVNVASVGLPPVAAQKAREWKRPLGTVAYALGALRAGLTAKPLECTLRCDGAVAFSGPAWQVTVACTGAFGAGSRVEADPFDGSLDAVVVEATRRAVLVVRAYGLRRGALESQPGVRSFRGRRLKLEAPAGTAYNVDGEIVEADGASFSAVPGAFEVVVG